MQSIIDERIRATKKLINENAEIRELIMKNQSYWDEIRHYNGVQLVQEIEPLWNNRYNITEVEAMKLTLLMLAYRLAGFDHEYFTAGASSGNRDDCVIV